MFKHIFASMKEKLNEIMIDYPHANEDQKKLHDEQLSVLKQFSDAFIEEWLQFEEIMADFREHTACSSKFIINCFRDAAGDRWIEGSTG